MKSNISPTLDFVENTTYIVETNFLHLSGLGLSGSLKGSLTPDLLVDASLAEGGVDGTFLLSLGDGSRLDSGDVGLVQGDDFPMGILSNVLELVTRSITLLDLGATGEDDELGQVLLKTKHVGLLGLDGLVPSSHVYSDSDGTSLKSGNTGLLELLGSEATTKSHLVVIALSRRADRGSQKTSSGTREDSSCLSLSGDSTTSVTSSLVEPSLDMRESTLVVVTVR